MKYSYLIFILFLPVTLSYAQIYKCKYEKGKVTFKDSECGDNYGVIRSRFIGDENPPLENNKEESQYWVDGDGKPGKVLFRDNKRLSPPYTIKVNEVRLITETKDTLVIDVIYTYEHKIPASEIKIYVMPNHGYWSTNPIQASKGHHVGRVSIGLSRSNMKKDRVRHSFTNSIVIRFEHYPPKKYKGVIWSETIKYEKNWKLMQ